MHKDIDKEFDFSEEEVAEVLRGKHRRPRGPYDPVPGAERYYRGYDPRNPFHCRDPKNAKRTNPRQSTKNNDFNPHDTDF